MPGPGPKYVSSDRNVGAMGTAIARMKAAIAGRPAPVAALEPTGNEGYDVFCRMAGLSATWAQLKARAIELNVALPGYSVVNDHRELFRSDAQMLRAWAVVHDPSLIDPAAEQHGEAIAVWHWW